MTMACCGHRSVMTPDCGRAPSPPREVDSPLHRCRESSPHAMAHSALAPDGRPRRLAPFSTAARRDRCSVTLGYGPSSPLIAAALVRRSLSRWWSLVVELPLRSSWAHSPLATAGDGRFLQRRGARLKLTPSGRSGAGAVSAALSYAAPGAPSRHPSVRARRPSLYLRRRGRVPTHHFLVRVVDPRARNSTVRRRRAAAIVPSPASRKLRLPRRSAGRRGGARWFAANQKSYCYYLRARLGRPRSIREVRRNQEE